MRRHGRRDANHAAVVAALRAAGRRVVDLGSVGNDVPDLLVAWGGHTMLLEVKTAKGVVTDGQRAFLDAWPGLWAVVRSPAEALAATGVR